MIDINNLNLYNYTTNDITIIYSDGTTGIIKALNVTSINIEKDFDNDFFPIFNLNVALDVATYRKITGDKNVQFRVSINKFAVKSTAEHVPSGIKYAEPVFSDVFYAMTNETDNDQLTKLEGQANKTKGVKSEDNFSRLLSLYLYKPHTLDVNNNPDSFIFGDADPMSVIVYLSDKFGVNKMMISSPDNTKKYPQIIIPGVKYTDMIKAMESIYGVYNKGSVLFYDFDNLFYISKDIVNNQALRSGEPSMVNIKFTEMGEGADRLAGSFLDSRMNRYYINSSSYPVIQDVGSYTQEVVFNNIEYVNTANGVNGKKSVKLNGRNIENKRLIDNKYSNMYAINSALYAIEESNYLLTVSLLNIDMTYMTPNKRYSLNFEFKDFENSKKYDGNYRLSKVIHTLSKNGNDQYLNCTSTCVLKRNR